MQAIVQYPLVLYRSRISTSLCCGVVVLCVYTFDSTLWQYPVVESCVGTLQWYLEVDVTVVICDGIFWHYYEVVTM